MFVPPWVFFAIIGFYLVGVLWHMAVVFSSPVGGDFIDYFKCLFWPGFYLGR